MTTTPTQIRIDSEIKQKANVLFKRLGLDMSGAVNMFLYQCVLRGGLPFPVEVPGYDPAGIFAPDAASDTEGTGEADPKS